jgi:uncharacterized protein
MLDDVLARYSDLLNKVDAFTAGVLRAHRKDIRCQKGCDECCRRPFSVFAVEAHNLKAGFDMLSTPKQYLILKKLGNYDPEASPCPLLDNGSCMLYAHRPVICRTHGLPIRSDLIRINGARLTALCDRNFNSPGSLYGLNEQHILNLDTLNTVLSSINLLYLKEIGAPSGAPSENGRLDMPDIFAGQT